MTDCSKCGAPIRVTKDQALTLECDGIHFIDDGVSLTPVRFHGLRIGDNSRMLESEYIGIGVSIGNFCDIFQANIGNHTKIKHFIEIQGGVVIGQFCKIESFVFIPSGVHIANYVFIGAHTNFTNDKYPQSTGPWQKKLTVVEDNVSIGAGCTILPGITIGKGAVVGAGSVVTANVEKESIVFGNPARFQRWL